MTVYLNRLDIRVFSFASSYTFTCHPSETQETTTICDITREIVVKMNKTTVSRPFLCPSSSPSSPQDTRLPYPSTCPTYTLFPTLSIPACSLASSTTTPYSIPTHSPDLPSAASFSPFFNCILPTIASTIRQSLILPFPPRQLTQGKKIEDEYGRQELYRNQYERWDLSV